MLRSVHRALSYALLALGLIVVSVSGTLWLRSSSAISLPRGVSSAKEAVLAAHPELLSGNLSDLSKVSILRDWAFNTVVIVDGAHTLIPQFQNLSVDEMHYAFSSGEGGVLCQGASEFLERIYHLFGFETAYTLGYGVYPIYTHAVTVVTINYNGVKLDVIQGATYNSSFVVSSTGEPLSLNSLLDLLQQRREGEIKMIQGAGLLDGVPDTVYDFLAASGFPRNYFYLYEYIFYKERHGVDFWQVPVVDISPTSVQK